ncbi:MAG: hypothetical protein CBC23_007835 [Rhodospirillaceae bacterium TMED63]|nr:MAG: hypothetical protein CBC23_007835 [Rhodospirillaceae bacterium TMED63]
MATVNAEGLSPDFDNLWGSPKITRRLSDKLPATFNHAYSTRENGVSSNLRSVLKIMEAKRLRNDLRTS